MAYRWLGIVPDKYETGARRALVLVPHLFIFGLFIADACYPYRIAPWVFDVAALMLLGCLILAFID